MDQREIKLMFRVRNIASVNFSYTDLNPEELNLIRSGSTSLNLSIATNFRINSNDSLIIISIITTVLGVNNEEIMKHVGRTTFDVQGLEETKDLSGEGFELPNEFVIQLYSISYTHARALLATMASSTDFKDLVILPVIDPKVFLEKHNADED